MCSTQSQALDSACIEVLKLSCLCEPSVQGVFSVRPLRPRLAYACGVRPHSQPSLELEVGGGWWEVEGGGWAVESGWYDRACVIESFASIKCGFQTGGIKYSQSCRPTFKSHACLHTQIQKVATKIRKVLITPKSVLSYHGNTRAPPRKTWNGGPQSPLENLKSNLHPSVAIPQ